MYKYYTNNALGLFENDCSVRAISTATNNSWDDTYKHLSNLARLNGTMMDEITDALGIVSYHMQDDNQTMNAISRRYLRKNDYNVKEIVPFSSKEKWSGISFDNISYVFMNTEGIVIWRVTIKPK